MENLHLLTPEIILFGSGLFIMLLSFLLSPKNSRVIFYISLLLLSYVLMLESFSFSYSSGMGTLWIIDMVSHFFKLIILIAAIFTILMSVNYPITDTQVTNNYTAGAYNALILFATSAMMLITSTFDFIYLFLSIEIMSLSCFILTGFDRKNPRSNEGAIKYFLIGGLSAAIMVYGISMFYGATGTTNMLYYEALPNLYIQDNLYILGLLFIIAGIGFKMSMVPFHFWTPDAYEAAPTPVTAYLSVASKLAAVAVFMRIFTDLIPHHTVGLNVMIAMLSLITMTVGNLMALFQNNIKRLLAYSSIAHAGYILIGLTVGDAIGRESVLIYSLAYLFTNIGAFAVAIVVKGKTGTYELEGFNGLAKKSLGLSLVMGVFLLSLIGIPPMAGFIGKFYVFASAINTPQYTWLAVAGIINSLISVYYYMKIAHKMFFVEPDIQEITSGRNKNDFHMAIVLALTTIFVLLIGILPERFLQIIQFCISLK